MEVRLGQPQANEGALGGGEYRELLDDGQPRDGLRQGAVRLQGEPEPTDEAERRPCVASRGRAIEGGGQVGALRVCAGRREILRAVDEPSRAVVPVDAPAGCGRELRVGLLPGERLDARQHLQEIGQPGEAGALATADQAVVEELLQQVEREGAALGVVQRGLGGLRRERAGELGDLAKGRLLGGTEEVPAQRDGHPERLVAGRTIRRGAAQHVELPVHPLHELRRRQEPEARSRELDRERKPAQRAEQGRERRGVGVGERPGGLPRAHVEQQCTGVRYGQGRESVAVGVGQRERGHLHEALIRQAEPDAARGDDPQQRRPRRPLGEQRRGSVGDLLQVVEHDQGLAQPFEGAAHDGAFVRDPAIQADRAGDRLGERAWIVHFCRVAHRDAARQDAGRGVRDREGEAGLPDAARPRQRPETRTGPDFGEESREEVRPADQWAPGVPDGRRDRGRGGDSRCRRRRCRRRERGDRRGRGILGRDRLDATEETVAPALHRLDPDRPPRVVVQRGTRLPHHLEQRVLGDEDPRPEPCVELLPRPGPTGALQERSEEQRHLVLERHGRAAHRQAPVRAIEHEGPEPERWRRVGRRHALAYLGRRGTGRGRRPRHSSLPIGDVGLAVRADGLLRVQRVPFVGRGRRLKHDVGDVELRVGVVTRDAEPNVQDPPRG